jgi:hypothetical protein
MNVALVLLHMDIRKKIFVAWFSAAVQSRFKGSGRTGSRSQEVQKYSITESSPQQHHNVKIF